MNEDVLETYVRKYIGSQNTPEINFAWQGGEPTLMGVDFFRKAVELQKTCAGDKRISNSFQTNGILIDDEWANFFSEENFLVGLSLDGPKEIHDRYRVDYGGRPTFEKVMKALRTLQKWDVQYNALVSVTKESARRPAQIYNFLKKSGVQFMQFIPIVERIPDKKSKEIGLELAEPRPWAGDESKQVTDFTVDPEEYGDFLISIFDRWVREDVGNIFVQIFDVALAAWMGHDPPLCNFSKTCGNAMIIEYNGDVYSCDHFVYPDHLLGNVMKDDLEDIVSRPAVRNLGNFKWDGLPSKCRDCEVLFICHGGCPKNRFVTTEDGEPGLNYLCDGYYKFFKHIDRPMKTMASLLHRRRPASEIMRQYRRPPATSDRPDHRKTPIEIGRNDPCPCGSGKKYKQCCGRPTVKP
jgi:uncharacterized protein